MPDTPSAYADHDPVSPDVLDGALAPGSGSASSPRQEHLAVMNNVAWCEAMCRAHGGDSQLSADWWVNRQPSPRLYPNFVSCSRGATTETLFPGMDAMAEKLPASGWGLKDSYNVLDLAPHGFAKLFNATWLWHSGSLQEMKLPGDFDWHQIESTRELALWELAWSGGEPVDPGGPLFRPALLLDPAVTLLGAWHGGELVAGFVANASPGVTGLSNLFSTVNDDRVWASAVQAAASRFPGCPLVGYESGADLEKARLAGFVSLHSLAVWIRSGS